MKSKKIQKKASTKRSAMPEASVFTDTSGSGRRFSRKEGKMKKAKAKSKNEGISKIQKIRNMFAEKDSWTVSELVKKSGYDERNLRTAISILKNPNRSKEPLITNYDKEKRIYSIK